MEKLYCYYGAKFWTKVIACFEIIWFSFFVGYFVLRSVGVFGNTLLAVESILHEFLGVNAHREGGDGHAHAMRISMMVTVFVGCYLIIGLAMGIMLLLGILWEKTRYLEYWMCYTILKYFLTTIILILDKSSFCDFITYSLALLFGTAFCISAVRTLTHEIKSKEEQEEKILPFRLSLDDVLVKFISKSPKSITKHAQDSPPYQQF